MPLGAVCLVTTLACGYASLLFKNIRLIMLVLACLPVMAGCAMIWKGEWSEGGATPLAGYTLIGFFAPVTSLIVSMGMANVAGNSKKSFMASGTFVMYCVGEWDAFACWEERHDADVLFSFQEILLDRSGSDLKKLVNTIRVSGRASLAATRFWSVLR